MELTLNLALPLQPFSEPYHEKFYLQLTAARCNLGFTHRSTRTWYGDNEEKFIMNCLPHGLLSDADLFPSLNDVTILTNEQQQEEPLL